MTKWTALFAGLVLSATSAFAQRVAPPDLGLSIWVPKGWSLSYLGGGSDFRYYSMNDTTGVHGAWFQFEVYSGTYNTSGSSFGWVNDEALVREYILQGDCYGVLLSDDTMRVDGAYAREVYGRSAICDSSSTQLLSPMQDRYYRITGLGDIGWVMSIEGDTADIDSASSTYLAVMDSVKLSLTFSQIPAVGVQVHPSRSMRPKRMVADNKGISVMTETNSVPEISVVDLQGRMVAGRVSSGGNGVWNWRPDQSNPGLVVIRVRSGSAQWVDRAVLPR